MKKGSLIYWTISEFEISPEKLKDLGFGDYTPRNDFKSAMIKALHKLCKGNERLYRAFNDTSKSISFGVFVQQVDGSDVEMRKEVIVNVDKSTGTVGFHVPPGVEWDKTTLMSDFEGAKTTLNANQIRAAILRYVRENHGISMRPSGGIYFVDDKFKEALDKLKTLFGEFSREMTLFEVPIYGDASTLDAIEEATSTALFGEVEKLVDEVNQGYQKGTLTKKQLQNRREDVAKILEEVKLHEGNLRMKANAIRDRVNTIGELVELKLKAAEGSIVDEGEFANLLRLL